MYHIKLYIYIFPGLWQYLDENKKYHTVGTLPKIPHSRNTSKNTTHSEHFQKYHTVGTLPKIPHSRNTSKNTTQSEHYQKYHTFGTLPKIPHIRNTSKIKQKNLKNRQHLKKAVILSIIHNIYNSHDIENIICIMLVLLKKAVVLSIIHNIYNSHDIENIICIMLVLLKKANGPNNHINIRKCPRASYDITVQQCSTLSHLFANTIFHHLYTVGLLLFNKILISIKR